MHLLDCSAPETLRQLGFRLLTHEWQAALAPVRWFYKAAGAETMRRLDDRFNFAASAGSGKGIANYVRIAATTVAASVLGRQPAVA